MRKILLYILLPLGAWAQTPVINIPMVELQDSRLSLQEVGRKQLQLDTNLLESHSTLADLLRQQGSIYIKEQGALASPSFRGTTASHTQLLWNGVPLNGLSHGQVDLALFPANLFSDVGITFGGHSAWTGSGAIGGSIHLKSDASFKRLDKTQLLASKGSFGQERYGANRLLSNEQCYLKVGFLHLHSDNNFEYINTGLSTEPIEKQTNAQISSKHWVGDYAAKLDGKNQISFHSWLQKTDSEVPGGMISAPSEAVQTDAAQRFSAEWKRQLKQGVFRFSQAYLLEQFNYKDPSKWIDSRYEAESRLTKLHYRHFSGNFTWDIGWEHTNNQLANNYYAHIPKENLTAFFTAFQLKEERWQGVLSLRRETHPLYAVPLIPSLGLDVDLLPNLQGKLVVSKNFKAPAFNDLYWRGGFAQGNTDLLPETAQSLECGLEWAPQQTVFSLTAYSTKLEDMIKWSPQQTGVWMPKNLLEVWARGVEFEATAFTQLGSLKSKLSASYSLTHSTLEKSALENDAAIGQQLSYVPKDKAAAMVEMNYRKWMLLTTASYIGEVNTTSDGIRRLDAYSLLDTQLKYRAKTAPVQLSFQVRNLLNTTYQLYEWYPTPRRNFIISISITI